MRPRRPRRTTARRGRRASVRSGRQDGFILVAVLGVMALLVSLTGGTALLVRAAFNGVRVSSDELKLEGLIRAGVELAAYELHGLKLSAAQIAGQRIQLDSGSITLSAVDETGRIDLNWSDPVLVAGAYRVSGLKTLQPKDFAARVVQWRDRYEVKSSAGTVANPNSLAAPPMGRGKDGFRSVADLRWLPDVSDEDAAALAPLLTVDNVEGRVNPAEASADVLLALPEMTPSLVAQVMALRALPLATAENRVKSLLQKQQLFLTTKRGPAFRVRVVASMGSTAQRSVDVLLVRAPVREVPYFVTSWSR